MNEDHLTDLANNTLPLLMQQTTLHFTPTDNVETDHKNFRQLERMLAAYMPSVFAAPNGEFDITPPDDNRIQYDNFVHRTLRLITKGTANDLVYDSKTGVGAYEALRRRYYTVDVAVIALDLFKLHEYNDLTALILKFKETTRTIEALPNPIEAIKRAVIIHTLAAWQQARVTALIHQYELNPDLPLDKLLNDLLLIAQKEQSTPSTLATPTTLTAQLAPPPTALSTAPTPPTAGTVDATRALEIYCERCTGKGHLAAQCPSPPTMVLCALCNVGGHVYTECRSNSAFRTPWTPARKRPIWRPNRDGAADGQGTADGRRRPRDGKMALCLTAGPPKTALIATGPPSRKHRLILDSGAHDTTITQGVTPQDHTHVPPLYDAGGNPHHAQHRGTFYATTLDGHMDLDITARQTPTIQYDLLSVYHIVHERNASVMFTPDSKGGSYIEAPNGKRIKVTSDHTQKHFVLEVMSRPPPPQQHTGHGQNDLRHPQPSTPDQDGPGLRMILTMMARPTWAMLQTALATGVAVGATPLTPALTTHHRLAPGLPRDRTTLHMTFAHAADDRIDATLRAYAIDPDTDAPQACDACTMANMQKTPTTRTSRGTPQPGLWEIDLHGPIHDGHGYALDAMHPMSGVIAYLPLQRKADVLEQLPVLIARIRAAGGQVDTVRADMGGEFTGHCLEPTLAILGCAITFITPELHVNRAEAAHKIANQGMRAHLATVPELTPFWIYARSTAIAAHNALISRRHHDIPIRQLTGHLPNLETLLPWGCNVAVLEHPATRSIQPRAHIARYLGPAPQLGTRAIYYTRDGINVRHTSTYRYIQPSYEHTPTEDAATRVHTVALLNHHVAASAAPYDTTITTTEHIIQPRLLLVDGAQHDASQRDSSSSDAPITPPQTTTALTSGLPPAADAQARPPQHARAPSPADSRAARADSTTHKSEALDDSNVQQRTVEPTTRTDRTTQQSVAHEVTPPQHMTAHTRGLPPAPTADAPPRLQPTARATSPADTTAARSDRTTHTTDALDDSTAPHPAQTSTTYPVYHTDIDALAKDHDATTTPPPHAPNNLLAALKGHDHDKWHAATTRQLDAFQRHHTMYPIKLEDIPDTAPFYRLGATTVIKRNGTYKVRIHVNGSVINKARATSDDHTAYEASNDHHRSSSPTASYDSLMLQTAWAAYHNQTILQDDVDDFYLLQQNEEPYAARFPPGLTDYYDTLYNGQSPFTTRTHAMWVTGNLWGHPDAGRIANEHFVPFITSMGFMPTPMDPVFFVLPRPPPTPSATLCLVVDDITVSSDERHAHEIMRHISDRYRTKGAHPADDVCNIRIQRLPAGYSVDQTAYIQTILTRHGYDQQPPAPTPLEAHFNVSPDVPDPTPDAPTPHFDNPRVILGELGFLRITRADIAYPVAVLATAVTVWQPKHSRNLARILWYLKHTPDKSCIYKRTDLPFELQDAYVDCSFGTELHHGTTGCAKSRSGVLIRIMNAPLVVISTRQTSTALSTSEGELTSLCLGTRRILPLRLTIMLLRNDTTLHGPTIVYEDNMSVIATLRRRVIAGRLRHVRVAISFILSAIEDGHIIVKYVPTHAQRADFLTKPLPKPLLRQALTQLTAP